MPGDFKGPNPPIARCNNYPGVNHMAMVSGEAALSAIVADAAAN